MKLTSSLPKEHGLAPISRALIDDPRKSHAVIALVDCKKITTDNDSGEIEPTARIRVIEVVTGSDLHRVERMLRRALEKRTGQAVLPVDLEDELETVFEGLRVHIRTGEVFGDPEEPARADQADEGDE